MVQTNALGISLSYVNWSLNWHTIAPSIRSRAINTLAMRLKSMRILYVKHSYIFEIISRLYQTTSVCIFVLFPKENDSNALSKVYTMRRECFKYYYVFKSRRTSKVACRINLRSTRSLVAYPMFVFRSTNGHVENTSVEKTNST